jgi:hypothetical protein
MLRLKEGWMKFGDFEEDLKESSFYRYFSSSSFFNDSRCLR